MRTSPALVTQSDIYPQPAQARLHELIRMLAGLTEGSSGEASTEPSNHAAEEILVDAEVDGCRYLLVRMPRLLRTRVQLSPREEEIVRMVAKGHPNKVIADVLSISSWTVCTHLRRIFAKLGVGSRAAMVAQLLEAGIMKSEPRPATSMTQTRGPA
jgi:DNA-binding CsgD family transcriptional regulator